MYSFISLLFSFAAIAGALFLLRRWRYRRLNLPPGSLGLPFVGETLQLISSYKTDNPEPFMDSRMNRYGPIFMTHVFGEPTVFSADPDTNRFILANEGKLFEISYPGSISTLLGKHSLLLMKGNLHKRMHSMTMSFASSAILKDHLLADADRIIRRNMDSWSDRVLLMEQAKKISFELTMKQLLSFDSDEWTENLRKHYVLMIEGFFCLPFTLLSPTYRRAIKARAKVTEALTVVERERRRRFERDGERKKDMLGAMMASGDQFSDDEIVDFLLALIVGGYETTSTFMTLAIKFLNDTPLALAQLKEEHDQIRSRSKPGATLEWADYKSMVFTQCVVNETLRMANIIGGIFRRTTTDINIKGYTIPKGWKVFASFRGVHLNPEHFKDARTFNPWRWNNSETTIPGNVYMPFGGGPRLCPGYELARVVLSVFLHRIITTFSWVPAEEDKLVFFPTTRTQKRLPIIVKPREESSQCI